MSKKTWTELLASCRARLLALPSKLAPEVFAADTVTEVKGLIKAGVIEALNELSELDAPETNIAQGAASTKATTEPDGIGLG